jgi:hypothetical protein
LTEDRVTDITQLSRALAIRAISRGSDETMNGAALAVVRADAIIGEYDRELATQFARETYDRLMATTPAEMPADPDDIAILLETLSQRLGGVSRAMAWRSIGINPNRGRDLLTRNAASLDWPIFFTLRAAALGESPKETPQ